MSFVYVLRSLTDGKRYTGFSSLEPTERLLEHNNGKVRWTRAHRPVELIYFERFDSQDLARRREKFFKTGKGRGVLDSLLSGR